VHEFPLNTTFELPLPLAVNESLYNFTIIQNKTINASKSMYFDNSVFYKLPGGFLESMEISGFRSYDVDDRTRDKNRTQIETYLNMSEIGMKINSGKSLTTSLNLHKAYYEYMNESFINQVCNQRREEGVKYKMCSCRGNNFFGMPEIIFYSKSDHEYVMGPEDYMLFPTIDGVILSFCLNHF